MAQKYHMNPVDVAAPCDATIKECPLGGVPHNTFETPKEAQTWAEEENAKKYGGSFGMPTKKMADQALFKITDSAYNREDAMASDEHLIYYDTGKLARLKTARAAAAAAIGEPSADEVFYQSFRPRFDKAEKDVISLKKYIAEDLPQELVGMSPTKEWKARMSAIEELAKAYHTVELYRTSTGEVSEADRINDAINIIKTDMAYSEAKKIDIPKADFSLLERRAMRRTSDKYIVQQEIKLNALTKELEEL